MSNGYWVRIQSSTESFVYNNNFINNTVQAPDSTNNGITVQHVITEVIGPAPAQGQLQVEAVWITIQA